MVLVFVCFFKDRYQTEEKVVLLGNDCGTTIASSYYISLFCEVLNGPGLLCFVSLHLLQTSKSFVHVFSIVF